MSTANYLTAKSGVTLMSSISFSLLDEQMTQDDKVFFKKLGQRLAALRKEIKLTQTALAEMLNTSQQLIAAYEAGSRKIPVPVLARMAQLYAVPLDELVGMKEAPTKRGPASKIQRQLEQISHMPRSKQQLAMDMLEAIIQQQAS